MYRDDHDAALQRIEALTDELARVVAERDTLAAKTAELEEPASMTPLGQRQRLAKKLAEVLSERDQLASQVLELIRRGTRSMTDKHSCPKCSGQLEQGFLVDLDQGGRKVQVWAAGPPEHSFWSATKAASYTFAVGTFRCTTCGFLESYARDEFSAR